MHQGHGPVARIMRAMFVASLALMAGKSVALGPDSLKWRFAVSGSYGWLLWDQQERLGDPEAPTWKAAFYSDRPNSPDGEVAEGDPHHRIVGAALEGRAGDRLELGVGWRNVAFKDHYTFPDFPQDVYYRYNDLRVEYTRSTRRKRIPQRPRFGFRYGAAMFLRQGEASTDYRDPSSYKVSTDSKSFLSTLQGTIWWGLRHERVQVGLVMHVNLMAYASGTLQEEEATRDQMNQWATTQRSEDYHALLFAGTLAQNNVFFSDLMLNMTVIFGKRP